MKERKKEKEQKKKGKEKVQEKHDWTSSEVKVGETKKANLLMRKILIDGDKGTINVSESSLSLILNAESSSEPLSEQKNEEDEQHAANHGQDSQLTSQRNL